MLHRLLSGGNQVTQQADAQIQDMETELTTAQGEMEYLQANMMYSPSSGTTKHLMAAKRKLVEQIWGVDFDGDGVPDSLQVHPSACLSVPACLPACLPVCACLPASLPSY